MFKCGLSRLKTSFWSAVDSDNSRDDGNNAGSDINSDDRDAHGAMILNDSSDIFRKNLRPESAKLPSVTVIDWGGYYYIISLKQSSAGVTRSSSSSSFLECCFHRMDRPVE
jgi:hypothetical protein